MSWQFNFFPIIIINAIIGEFTLPKADHTPTAEETAEQECAEKERERNRLRYQQRKASGYYDKAKKAKSKQPALPMAANQ